MKTLDIEEIALVCASLKQTQDLCRKIAASDVPQRVHAAAQAAQIDTIIDKLIDADEVVA